MKIIKAKQVSAPFATMCYSAALAFLAAFVFDINLVGSLFAFVLIFSINMAVEFYGRKEQRAH